MGVRHEWTMSPWLFSIFKYGCMTKKMAAKKWKKLDARLNLNGVDWSVAACLFSHDTVLLVESERKLQRVVDQFHSACNRRKSRVNAGKSKVMVSERNEVEMVDFRS